MTTPGVSDRLAAEFEAQRGYLLRVAYSHLGTLAEAEDVVQDAWLRLERTDRTEIRDLRAWLATVVSRLALDALTSARARRERYVGPWLPEPVVDSGAADADPAARVDLDESVSMALLIVLEALSPAERSAFVLHDVFGYSFTEVASIVNRTPQATRQLAARARHAVEARRPRYPATSDKQREVVDAFIAAAMAGDIAALLELLDPDVSLCSDGGGLVNAARTVFVGAARVAQIVTAMATRTGANFRPSPALINGAPGLVVETSDSPSVVSFTIDAGRITEIDLIRNPDKLRTLRRARRDAADRPASASR